MIAKQTAEAQSAPLTAVVLVGTGGAALWTLTPEQRLERVLRRSKLNARRVVAVPADADRIVLLRRDWYIEERAVKTILTAANTVVTAMVDGRVAPIAANVPPALGVATESALNRGDLAALPAGLRVASVEEVCGAYNAKLRKSEPPLVLDMTATPALEVERAMYRASYKGVTDIITKYVWPIPAFWVTRAAAWARLTPNTITTVGLLLVLLAQWLFWHGSFWAGLLAGYVMVFLDTVDGKLARVTLTSSAWGNIFDHGIDLIHPPFWYWAWWVGLGAVGLAATPVMAAYGEAALWVILGGYVLGRVAEAIFLHSFGFHIHIWKPVDARMREITARRNPNMLILTAGLAVGRPDLGFLGVALWTLICVPFHFVRLGQALVERLRGRPIRSWMAEQT